MESTGPMRVNVVRLGKDGKEETIASAFLAGGCVLMTGSAESIEGVRSDVSAREGIRQDDGEAFLGAILDAYPATTAVAYGAWCAVVPKP